MGLCLRAETEMGSPGGAFLPSLCLEPHAALLWWHTGGGRVRTVAETSSQSSADAFCREASLGELAKHKHLQEVEMRLSNSPSQCQHSRLGKLCSKHGVVESLYSRQQHVPGVFQQYNPFLSF